MSIKILCLGAVTNTVRENRLQPIEVRADNVWVLVDNHACKILPHATPHHARLAVIHRKSFFVQNRTDVCCKSIHTFCELFAP